MKRFKIKTIYTFISSLLIFQSCNNEFLDILPKDQQTEMTAFITSENFETFALSLYDIFPGYNSIDFDDDVNGGNFVKLSAGGESPWSMSRVIIPSSDGDWDFKFIRQVNLMLSKIDASNMTESEKTHWRSVGYFFRSYRYYILLSKFGEVPWIEHVLNENDPALYTKRDTRDLIAQNILRDLQYASENIQDKKPNTINSSVVHAFISRFGLFEGTWRKYHNLSDANTYLQAARLSAERVLQKHPHISSNYDLLFNSESLASMPGILLYKEYASPYTMHSRTRSVRTGEARVEATRALVDSYLCTDGRPISTSPLYAGFQDEYSNFRNRDTRLYTTVCPPYRTGSPNSGSYSTWERSPNPHDSEYIDLINHAEWKGAKSLPYSNFRNFYSGRNPNLRSSTNGYHNWGATNMGYFMWKFYNETTDASSVGTNTTDAPIFRIEEVMLNYAEASYELNQFTQDIADITINKLRERAGVAAMTLSLIDHQWDNQRDSKVAPILWEIRRERKIELVGEGFAFNDIRRWKTAPETLNKKPLGAYIDKSEYGSGELLKIQDKNGNTLTQGSGFLWYFNTPTGFLSHYYLYPLPTNQLVLNENLDQNPGWK
ncbi:RagB/SusD family nutrient uptake outer membrane protein [Sphingobacterium sp. UT-1RO-CII-1]|uniref:RagB/SusD family nutrient uptake outer membrane protein n=1 Tax=Sphingobacterium sp. UT-1RO-CII-1 TaxID=2995225 RepID=UPI00227BD90B|nr:RagB/SusD family nutrient uptake outer membrane protein [Sphingobacterium sp. UT-1RO-CII-1]MCY4780026.1 RagB/SusD family nutrient uptake outer membrane protein [Sphingobacterium sp. UT-1RO-CII-1]